MPNEFIIKNGFFSQGNSNITGSLTVSGSITGSFTGSFTGDGSGLYNIPSTGIVGLNLSQIASGSATASISPDMGLQVNTNVTATSFTGSLFGTASWANNAVTASYIQTAQTASYVLNAISSSFATSASFAVSASFVAGGSGLTVGTTAITSGTAGRVLFEGTGNVVQESQRMTFDGSKYIYNGTSVTANASIFEILGNGGQRALWAFQDNSIKIGGNNNAFTTKGAGTGQATNNFYSNDSHFCFGGVDTSKGWVHIGVNDSNPQARLDIRAQGALSTDIAFRVRNSADTANLIDVLGNGQIGLQQNASFGFYGIRINTDSSIDARVGSSTAVWRINNSPGTAFNEYGFANNIPTFRIGTTFGVYQSTDNREYTAGFFGRGIVTIGQNPFAGTIKPNEANTNTMYVFNGTTPTLSATDSFNLYSADITAGNAAPHFRTENGAIVKVYQETTGVAAATLVGGGGTTITDTDTFGGYTLRQIAQALKNLGILA